MTAPSAAPAATNTGVLPRPAGSGTGAATPPGPPGPGRGGNGGGTGAGPGSLLPDVPELSSPARRFRWTVPVRTRTAAGLVLALIAGLFAALAIGVSEARSDLHTVGNSTGPQAATATDLYYALADLDAQVANVLLIGHDEQIGNKQSALRQLRHDREAVTAAVQDLLQRGLDREGADTTRKLLADLAAYDALAGQARLADDQAQDRTVGRPPALAVNFYLAATSLMHQDLLPAAEGLGRSAEHGLAESAGDGRDHAQTSSTVVAALGGSAVAALVALQIWLARRFRRLINPALAAATVAVAVLTVLGAGLLADHGDRVQAAKSEAFDPYTALARTRALASDANADESRYMLLPEQAPYYRAQFAAKAELLAAQSKDPGLAQRLAAFRRDDAELQKAVSAGRLEAAIGMATNVGRGNLAFEFFDYQSTLDSTAQTHHDDFTARIDDAEDALSGWQFLPAAVLGVGGLLVIAGVRPRLREYR
ncbi:hypothetical protein [Yinghuangia soli]|uniref:Secreted protein n=1 Tax=Yinghuangia soli TaxID=2908204 RepID=A0AA41Q9D5_9ACTN|nr:hypothetical protein [Yinghuangia soli]MCF2533843.1 hypothetical protein [Yinghuangia soli]